MEGGGSNVSLTAHLLITLYQVMPVLDGQVRVEANNAKQKALRLMNILITQLFCTQFPSHQLEIFLVSTILRPVRGCPCQVRFMILDFDVFFRSPRSGLNVSV